MGRGIYIGISPTEQEESAACAVCLGSHAARGDHGGCDSAKAARLGSHAARGGRGGRSSANTMRVVVRIGSHDARAAGGAAGAS